MNARRACLLLVVVGGGALAAGCPAGGVSGTCTATDQCPAGFACVDGLCVRAGADANLADRPVVDARVLDARVEAGAIDRGASERAPNDLVAADLARDDAVAGDAARHDAWPADTAVRLDAAAPPDAASALDAAASSDATSPPDAAVPTDLASPADRASPADTAPRPDATAAPDTAAPPDASASVDTCDPRAGQLCARNDHCGATYDCLGQCAGGTEAPDCPECGTRTCQNLQSWSGCIGPCGENSTCNPATGRCACTVDECEGEHCCGPHVCGCFVDVAQCGSSIGVVQACDDERPCDVLTASCGGSACDFTNCSGCCADNGVCLDGYANNACGASGSLCTDCTQYGDGCQFWDCDQNRECSLYQNYPNGTGCGANQECWGGRCTTCDPRTGQACTFSCNCGTYYAGFPGTILCPGVCALPPGCTCFLACQGPCW